MQTSTPLSEELRLHKNNDPYVIAVKIWSKNHRVLMDQNDNQYQAIPIEKIYPVQILDQLEAHPNHQFEDAKPRHGN